jgi:glycosyltransferase involved in cell wall biosynthesis
MKKNKVAIMSDQICGGIGGAESILFGASELYPDAPVYTTIYSPEIIPDKYKNINFIHSFIQNLPFAQKIYKAYFPLMPLAVEMLDLQEYDVVFSSHHCVAKGVITRPDAVHICYCHSPARYIWDMFWAYSKLNGFNYLIRFLISCISYNIRIWDVVCSNRTDYFIANSSYTANRIKKFYGRDAEVLFPPVDTKKFSHESDGDYYLMTGRLVAYKGFELAVQAFNLSGKKLVIVGDGAEFEKLKALAKSNITMTGRVSDTELVKYMNNCKGFIFPGKEDFGIVMAEAQSAGKPVIAFNGGGACDIIINKKTGILFDEQTPESLNNAVMQSESVVWDHEAISRHAEQFDKSLFFERLKYIIDNADKFKLNNAAVSCEKVTANISKVVSDKVFEDAL